MYFIITRPTIDTKIIAEKLSSLKLQLLFEPMLEIRPIDSKTIIGNIKCDEFDGVIFTSSNAIRAVGNLKDLHKKQIYVVGEKTAQLAGSHGFEKVIIAGSNVDEFCDYFANNKKLASKRLVYFSGTYVTKDLKVVLGNLDYEVEQVICYESLAVKDFSSQFIDKLNSNFIGAVSFYSQLTAENFIRLAKKDNLIENLKHLEAFVLSEKIADSLRQVKWKMIHVAKDSDEKNMVELVRRRYGKEEI